MAGVWEEVHGLDGAYVVVWGEVCEVACEGCRVTADAEDLRDVCVNQGIQQFAVAAFAWRVDDGEVGVVAFVEPFWEPYFRFCGCKVCIFEAVGFGCFFGVFDGLANTVNAGEGLVAFGNKAPNGANAAIQVQNARIGCEVNHVLATSVEHFRLGGVHLKEGGR